MTGMTFPERPTTDPRPAGDPLPGTPVGSARGAHASCLLEQNQRKSDGENERMKSRIETCNGIHICTSRDQCAAQSVPCPTDGRLMNGLCSDAWCPSAGVGASQQRRIGRKGSVTRTVAACDVGDAQLCAPSTRKGKEALRCADRRLPQMMFVLCTCMDVSVTRCKL